MQKQPLHNHLAELRTRLMVVALALILFSSVGFFFNKELQEFLIAPLNEELYYTSPAGGFNFTVQIALLFGLVCTVPVFIFQALKFTEPAMRKGALGRVWWTTVISVFLSLTGASFAYFLALPVALNFLTNFSDQTLESLITTQDYLAFLNVYIMGFVLIFQIPLVIYLASKSTMMSTRTLLKGLRPFILVSVVVSAIITPTTDPLNLAIMAVPMILLYVLSIFISWATLRKST